MELRHLRYFVAVAEEGGFSKAAVRLRVAQPALSKQIQDLEAEVGASLFVRSRQGARLTGAGEVFLDRARGILQSAQEAVAAARRVTAGEQGRISVGFIGSISHELLPRILQAYRRRYPDVELSLVEMSPLQQLEALRQGQLDVGFLGLVFPEQHPDLHIKVLAEEPLMAAVPEDHPLAQEKRLSLRQLESWPFILTSRRNAPVFNDWLIGLCRTAGFVPQVAKEVDRAPTVLNYVAAGFGLSVFPAQIARLPAPGVAFIPLAASVPRYRYGMAWKGEKKQEPAGRLVVLAGEVAKALRK
jgi:DNA-binding transcriptional LysR family regulator